MKFSGIPAQALRVFAVVVSAVTGLMAGCGGGTQIDPFRPTRALAFGDEYSVVTSTKLKYTVNAVTTPASSASNPTPSPVISCEYNRLWMQSVALSFGLYFDECLPSTSTSSGSKILAKAGAKAVADSAGDTTVKQQVDGFLQAGGQFTDNDIVTVMAGLNDVVALYKQYPATQESTLLSTAEARGKALAEQVNRIAVAGPAVIVMRIPDVSLTPYGRAQTEAGRTLLHKLTDTFNTSMQLSLINDGHLIGLVFGDVEIEGISRAVDLDAKPYNIVNNKNAVCLAAKDSAADPHDVDQLPGCTAETASLVTGVTDANTYLWAGNLMLGPIGQDRLGAIASTRALNNPF